MHAISFDDEKSAIVRINAQRELVFVELSDSLDAFDEELSDHYVSTISTFIGQSDVWYRNCVNVLNGDQAAGNFFRLMVIYVLFEQSSSDSVFGLLFRVDGDIEHGRGFKVNGDDFSIMEYGLGDISFC